jgi:hypothetical protein
MSTIDISSAGTLASVITARMTSSASTPMASSIGRKLISGC